MIATFMNNIQLQIDRYYLLNIEIIMVHVVADQLWVHLHGHHDHHPGHHGNHDHHDDRHLHEQHPAADRQVRGKIKNQ